MVGRFEGWRGGASAGARRARTPEAVGADAPATADDAGRLRAAAATAAPALRGPQTLAVLEASRDAIVGVRQDGRVAVVNAAATRIFGGTREELLGRPADTLVPRLADAVRTLARRRAAGAGRGGAGTDDARLQAVRVDGTTFPAAVALTPLPSRRDVLVVATVRDLTAAVQAEATAEELRSQVREAREVVGAVLAAVPDHVVVVTDADGRITSTNRAAEQLLEYGADELVGRPSTCLSEPGQLGAAARELGIAPGLDPLLEAARAGLSPEQPWTYVTRGGEQRSVTVRVTAVGPPLRPTAFVCVATPRHTWEPVLTARTSAESLLLDLDDAPTRALRWQVGVGAGRRR